MPDCFCLLRPNFSFFKTCVFLPFSERRPLLHFLLLCRLLLGVLGTFIGHVLLLKVAGEGPMIWLSLIFAAGSFYKAISDAELLRSFVCTTSISLTLDQDS